MTGLPCSGKTTIAKNLNKFMPDLAILDGDELRDWLSAKKDFSKNGRSQHNIVVTHIARLLLQHKISCCVSLVSPYIENRQTARRILGGKYKFVEVYVKCSLPICEARDVNGMYVRTRKGEISQFTGIDDVYQIPSSPDLTIDTENTSIDFATERIIHYLDYPRDHLNNIEKCQTQKVK